jgi:SnoaL-like domain
MLNDEQLQELWDTKLLHDNATMYVRGVDRMDRELIESTFWPESTVDVGAFRGSGAGWAEEATRWKDVIWSTNHHTSNILIEFDGERARRESMFINVVNLKDPATSMFTGGRNRDLCEKREGTWKILARVTVFDWCEQRPTLPGWEALGAPEESNWGAFKPDDPIYKDWTVPSPTPFPRAHASTTASGS